MDHLAHKFPFNRPTVAQSPEDIAHINSIAPPPIELKGENVPSLQEFSKADLKERYTVKKGQVCKRHRAWKFHTDEWIKENAFTNTCFLRALHSCFGAVDEEFFREKLTQDRDGNTLQVNGMGQNLGGPHIQNMIEEGLLASRALNFATIREDTARVIVARDDQGACHAIFQLHGNPSHAWIPPRLLAQNIAANDTFLDFLIAYYDEPQPNCFSQIVYRNRSGEANYDEQKRFEKTPGRGQDLSGAFIKGVLETLEGRRKIDAGTGLPIPFPNLKFEVIQIENFPLLHIMPERTSMF